MLDTASGRCGLAGQSEGRETQPFRLIREALEAAGVRREQIERVAVGLGPGSYTGIRNALALAQGWQFAREVETVGLSSVACLAAGLHRAGRRGKFRFVVDAQRGEFYESGWLLTATHPVETLSLRIRAPGDILNSLAPEEVLAGPEVPRLLAGAAFDRVGVEQVFPGADALARLAAPMTTTTPAQWLEPIYLREVAFAKAPPPRSLA